MWNQTHACVYCTDEKGHKLVTNISKHLRTHTNKPEVKEILKATEEFGPKNKMVRAMWDILRNKGDNSHNKEVLDQGEGEFLLGRRSVNGNLHPIV